MRGRLAQLLPRIGPRAELRNQWTLDARPLALALTLLAFGCEPEPDFVTRHGVAFHLQGTAACTREQAEAMETELLRRLDEASELTGAARRRCLAQTQVIFEPGLFECTLDPSRTCAGEQQGATLRIAAHACPYQSAFVHELLHWLQECVEGRFDYEHQASSWAVVQAQLAEAKALCEPELIAPSRSESLAQPPAPSTAAPEGRAGAGSRSH